MATKHDLSDAAAKDAAAQSSKATSGAAERQTASVVTVRSAGTTGRGRTSRPDADAKPVRTVEPSRRRPLVLIAVIVASVIMVGSMLLPSLSAVVSGISEIFSSADATTEEATETEDTTTEVTTTEDATTEEETSEFDTYDAQYESEASELATKLEESPDDLALIINTANAYYSWAAGIMSYAETDEQQQHVSEVLEKAKGYYDSYLAQNDANSARANRAMCQFYLGDVESAAAELTGICEASPDFAPAWANLGLIYEALGDTESATSAYNMALEADPDDKYGLQSSLTSQLESLTASTDEASSEETTSE